MTEADFSLYCSVEAKYPNKHVTIIAATVVIKVDMETVRVVLKYINIKKDKIARKIIFLLALFFSIELN